MGPQLAKKGSKDQKHLATINGGGLHGLQVVAGLKSPWNEKVKGSDVEMQKLSLKSGNPESENEAVPCLSATRMSRVEYDRERGG